ncbi:PAS domain S-box protein [Sulfurospirillum sp. T05]|uniref:histidine kinase n=1 Tax=Sulfurospirillum tamanense TaxID=2813362 RepID=A0ABS2WT84_9BACT|nr:PAS domain S-box protein [Sulfurospirillum tamanensis]
MKRSFRVLNLSLLFGVFVVIAFALFVRYDMLKQAYIFAEKQLVRFDVRHKAIEEDMAHKALLGAEFIALSPMREAIEAQWKQGKKSLLISDIQASDPDLARNLASLGIACVIHGHQEMLPMLFVPECNAPVLGFNVLVGETRVYVGFLLDRVFELFKRHDDKPYGLALKNGFFEDQNRALGAIKHGFLMDFAQMETLFSHSNNTFLKNKHDATFGAQERAVLLVEDEILLVLPFVLNENFLGYFIKKETIETLVGSRRYVKETYGPLGVLLLTMFAFGYFMWQKKEALRALNSHVLKQKEQTEALIEEAEFGVAYVDASGLFSYANEKFFDLLHVEPRFVLGENIAYFFGRDQAREMVKKAFAGEKIKARHYFCYLDQTTVDLEVLILLNPEKNALHYMIFSRKEKTDLERLLKRTSVYFNHSDLGHIITDETFVVIECNDTLERLCGFSKKEIVGQNMGILFHTGMLFETWKKNYAQALLEPTGAGFEYRLSHKTKGVFWVEMFGNTFIESGRKQYIFSIRDISVRVNARNTIRRLNEGLQQKYNELETILEVIPLPVFIKDKEFRYIGCNRAFCDFFNVEKEHMIGQTVADLFPETFSKRVQKKDQMMLQQDFQQYKSVVALSGDKKEGKVLEFHKKAFYKEGQFDGFVGLVLDITSKEKEKQILKEAVKREVEKNIQILEQHQEEKIKDAKFSSIGKMAAGITHEINTPLTYIKGNVELLRMDIESIKEESLRESMLKDTQTILEGLGRIANIIESMREASQKSSETPEVINLFETLVHALVLSHNRAKQIVAIRVNRTPFNLSFSKEAYRFTCKVQKQRIEQVWIIILNNALDELIKIDTFENRLLDIWMHCDKERIIVRFKDNAGGIDAKILPTLFEPFVSTKTSSGMGIGLNIAQKIVGEQKGTIRAFNEDQGAVLEVVLPSYKENK